MQFGEYERLSASVALTAMSEPKLKINNVLELALYK